MTAQRLPILVALAALLGGCAHVPAGPSMMVLPGSSKSFEAFQLDDAVCRGWANQQTGVSPGHAAHETAASGAVVGTAVGAASGALIGAASGNAGPGAAIGAGAGLLLGSSAGASHAAWVGSELQRRYDFAYTQCMYAKGNQVPMARSMLPAYRPEPESLASPSQGYYGGRRNRIPRPPAGPPPPPPDEG